MRALWLVVVVHCLFQEEFISRTSLLAKFVKWIGRTCLTVILFCRCRDSDCNSRPTDRHVGGAPHKSSKSHLSCS